MFHIIYRYEIVYVQGRINKATSRFHMLSSSPSRPICISRQDVKGESGEEEKDSEPQQQ